MSAPTIVAQIAVTSSKRLWSLPNEEAFCTAELMSGAGAVAQAIRQLPGFRPGCHIALNLPTSREWIEALLGAWFAQAVPAALNPYALPEELSFCIDELQAVGIIDLHGTEISAEVAPQIARISLCGSRSVHPSPLPGGAPIPPFDPRDCEQFHVDATLDALVLFTSGSSGRPKGVRLSHRGLVASVAGLTAGIEPRDEVFLLQAPMHHVFGVVTCLLALSTQSGAVLLPAFAATTMLEAIVRYRATISFGPPELFLGLSSCPGLARYDLRSFRRILVGGSPCRLAQLLEIERALGLETIFLSFGMTETTGGISLAPLRASDGRPRVHAGRPVPTIEVAVRCGDVLAGPGEEGELCFRGAHLLTGYLGQPEHGENDWLASGDLGLVDADGLLHVTDRIKDIIIKAGENISIAEVERVLLETGRVREVCVVGVPDERLGENVAAAVISTDSALNKRELQRLCQGKLLKSRIPQKIVFVDELPRLPTGKVARRAVRALILEDGKGKSVSP
ncbi:MAG: acyl--CoA ligase [Myxococcota bacterium]|jgi:long-chain acyl-CoA synthetase|nr:acyl--CoA ligase [Myxococcota bacterium]